MNFNKLRYIVSVTAVLMILHTVEEYLTKLWNFDQLIIAFSQYFKLNPINIYIGVQLLALLVIALALLLAFRNKSSWLISIVLGLIFILELSHLYSSLKVWGYYPGLYTGIALVIIGWFYWRELIANYKHTKTDFR